MIKPIYDYCLECNKKKVFPSSDLELCEKCKKKFDLNLLWNLHDKNIIDALDFNESASFREKFRIKGK